MRRKEGYRERTVSVDKTSISKKNVGEGGKVICDVKLMKDTIKRELGWYCICYAKTELKESRSCDGMV